MPTMITLMAKNMTKIEKTFKVLGIDGESTYAFGENISYTDLGKGLLQSLVQSTDTPILILSGKRLFIK